MYKNELKDEEVFLLSSEKIENYTGNKQEFIGENNLQNPKKVLSNDSGLYKESCIAMQVSLKLEPYETKELALCLGVKEQNTIIPIEYSNVEKCKEELKNTQKYWYDLLSRVHVNTPVESINIMLNGWAAYQSITSRLWAKSGYYGFKVFKFGFYEKPNINCGTSSIYRGRCRALVARGKWEGNKNQVLG